MDVTYNLHSMRAQKARFSLWLTKSMRLLLAALALTLLFAGIALVAVGTAFGWLLASLAVIPAMTLEWYKRELKSLPASKHSSQLDDVLDVGILGRLKRNSTAQDIATMLGQTNGGLFFGVRFGLTPRTLQHLAEVGEISTDAIWQQALALHEEQQTKQITPGQVLVAFVSQFPQLDTILAQLHIDQKDLQQGLVWQQHIEELIQHHQQPRRTGGIARDLSFGYTPLLARFGRIAASGNMQVDIEAHAQAVDRMIETFGGGGRQNVALIGSAGTGKSTVVEAFAERILDAEAKLPGNLRFRQVMLLDAASMLSAANGRGELEGLVQQVLGEAFAAKNIIICLDNAQLFFEEGVGSIDLSNVLLPILEAGRLRIILTLEEQRYLQISQRNPALANALNRIMLAPADERETRAVMQDQLLLYEYQRKATYTYQSLAESYRLSERYVHDLAQPGRALKLLEAAAGYAENGLVTMNSVQQAIEQTMNVKVGTASNEDDKQKLLNLEELIHKRMINQTRAVSVVSDALRRARAGVRNENRPIGTFLFLGPTGVGKTELAKALGEVYFGGEDRLIRIDMNEFVELSDVRRLIADGAENPNSLTAQVMKQPFSVILLDEIEKAHPNVLTALLQVLDEGILRDEKNRDVSFRDAIFIATSNAGADRIREYIQRGYKLTEFEQELIDEVINNGQFKPEFINRFDETVVFTPLGKAELLQVIDLILQGVNKTLEPQKVQVEVTEEARRLLVEKGYDPRLGARPMRRIVQKTVENTVAKMVLSGEATAGSTITIGADLIKE